MRSPKETPSKQYPASITTPTTSSTLANSQNNKKTIKQIKIRFPSLEQTFEFVDKTKAHSVTCLLRLKRVNEKHPGSFLVSPPNTAR